MRISLTLVFIIVMVISFILQMRNLRLKNYVSPGLTVLCAFSLLFGVRMQNVSWWTGMVLVLALLLLAASDFVFERSTANAKLFPLALGFGMISGFIFGLTFNYLALDQGISGVVLGGYYLIAILAGILVYRYLQVDPALKVPIMIYLAQVIILLAGGLASFSVGNPYFGIWGVFIFISDFLVGLRAFPNPDRPIPWLTPGRILVTILVLYYSAQLSLVAWALWS